jgi:hypothetical protein
LPQHNLARATDHLRSSQACHFLGELDVLSGAARPSGQTSSMRDKRVGELWISDCPKVNANFARRPLVFRMFNRALQELCYRYAQKYGCFQIERDALQMRRYLNLRPLICQTLSDLFDEAAEVSAKIHRPRQRNNPTAEAFTGPAAKCRSLSDPKTPAFLLRLRHLSGPSHPLAIRGPLKVVGERALLLILTPWNDPLSLLLTKGPLFAHCCIAAPAWQEGAAVVVTCTPGLKLSCLGNLDRLSHFQVVL